MTTKNNYHGQKQMVTISTLAFFISVMVWFNMAPFQSTIQLQLDLTDKEIGALMIVNLALSIPGRIIIGRLVDRYGPRKVFSILLITMSVPCFFFAIGTNYVQLLISRLILGTIGASFVIGIRMVTEWVPAGKVGFAQGIYAGWGNFGSSFAALTLPPLALIIGGENGWRYAILLTGILALIYGIVFYFTAKNTPDWREFPYTKNVAPLQATTKSDLIILTIISFPIYGGIGILIWTLNQNNIISDHLALLSFLITGTTYLFNMGKRWRRNEEYIKNKVPDTEKYSMKNVAILSMGYFTTFGSELAIISMLPMYFQNSFAVNAVIASTIASSFAFTNLFARPAGGWLSDRFGRKKILLLLLALLSCLYAGMSFMQNSWPIYLVILLIVCCSLISQAASGAIFSMVSLIKKNQTGQISGMVGAYGNIGSLCFLAVLNVSQYNIFFLTISIGLLLCFLTTLTLQLQSKLSTKTNVTKKLARIN
ncbi:MFS transporter, NNP family, nitrate/nitrite transporter [Gracilibacillus ureilyticus]|uniref:MFS transporter, NNP family, nitrate/nitrite transporter n=1 Tax=Gracilibacillus ureilyticus TaxID=531814 RepID=A0A1H9TPL1_9BACI|nr:MFS transporter [Gracilibacillus ureilyticus]SER98997.1 MFS transporter, NNP family, nitrate/nitrite transporter [Gracilibacillus ureilyticus]